MNKSDVRLFVALSLIVVFLAFGTVFFQYAEDWSYVDSFYFSASTVTTVGFGDLVPTNDTTKLVTAFYSIFGVGVFLYSIAILTHWYFLRQERRWDHLVSLKRKK